jgi:hypothetical protein
MKVTSLGAGVFTIEDYLSPQECERYIALGERMGYDESEITTLRGSEMFKAVRNNYRVIFDDVELASALYERAKPHLPAVQDDWSLCGFNERLRFYRYGPGEYFKWHKDGSFQRSPHEESFLTFMIYLNDQFEGGETQFKWETVAPKPGTALVFPHRMLHQGATVTSGTKYVLRTDIMYRAESASAQPKPNDSANTVQ